MVNCKTEGRWNTTIKHAGSTGEKGLCPEYYIIFGTKGGV